MLLIGLLLVALACLVVGLVLASGIWLVGSVVASGVAGYVLWKQREQIAARTGVHKNQAAPKMSPPTAKASPTSTREQDVWVVDGQPQFHMKDCREIAEQVSAGSAEAIPYAQATEDGFSECTVCTPAVATTGTAQVWVVDGRPDYHVEDCRSLKIATAQSSGDSEAIPRAQAVEDGFSACPDCRPDAAASADSAAPISGAGSSSNAASSHAGSSNGASSSTSSQPSSAASSDPAPDGPRATTVWVVDGRPRFHLADCMIIKDQDAQEIPVDQATEDGFMACSMCEPAAARV